MSAQSTTVRKLKAAFVSSMMTAEEVRIVIDVVLLMCLAMHSLQSLPTATI